MSLLWSEFWNRLAMSKFFYCSTKTSLIGPSCPRLTSCPRLVLQPSLLLISSSLTVFWPTVLLVLPWAVYAQNHPETWLSLCHPNWQTFTLNILITHHLQVASHTTFPRMTILSSYINRKFSKKELKLLKNLKVLPVQGGLLPPTRLSFFYCA